MRLPATLDSFRAQPIAFLHPRRQEERGRGAVGGEHFVQEREGGNTVDVVVAIEDDAMVFIQSAQDPIHRRLHVGEQKRVAQSSQARLKKISRLFVVEQSPALQKAGNAGQAADMVREYDRTGRAVRGSHDPASRPLHFAITLGERLRQSLGVERGVNLGIIIKVNENVASAPPAPDSFRPGREHAIAVAADVELGVTMQTTVNEIGRQFLGIGPVAGRWSE